MPPSRRYLDLSATSSDHDTNGRTSFFSVVVQGLSAVHGTLVVQQVEWVLLGCIVAEEETRPILPKDAHQENTLHERGLFVVFIADLNRSCSAAKLSRLNQTNIDQAKNHESSLLASRKKMLAKMRKARGQISQLDNWVW
jgi:hypothetical protein